MDVMLGLLAGYGTVVLGTLAVACWMAQGEMPYGFATYRWFYLRKITLAATCWPCLLVVALWLVVDEIGGRALVQDMADGGPNQEDEWQ